MDPRLEAIALLYLTFAHATDGTLSGDEMRMLATKLRAWQPQASLDSVADQIKATVVRYKRLGDQPARIAEAHRCATRLANGFDPDARGRVLADLRELAMADGKETPEETSFLEEIAVKLLAARV